MRRLRHNNMKAKKSATYAAIDIGSNGARLLVKRFTPREDAPALIEGLIFVRVPLRLGQDVFTLGKISEKRYDMMKHMMKGYAQFMKFFDVDRYRACATSAMRDAENGQEVLQRLEEDTGIKLEIIKGKEEAGLLSDNLVEKTDSNEGVFAYIDVGGGSTEVSLIHDGKFTASRSYNIGTLRLLAGQVTRDEWDDMRRGLSDFSSKFGKVTIIGSGGNINKLCKLANDKKSKQITVDNLRSMYEVMKPLSVEERMARWSLKADRADVIVPAAEIFLTCAECLECDVILVPNISLADSIVDWMYKHYMLDS